MQTVSNESNLWTKWAVCVAVDARVYMCMRERMLCFAYSFVAYSFHLKCFHSLRSLFGCFGVLFCVRASIFRRTRPIEYNDQFIILYVFFVYFELYRFVIGDLAHFFRQFVVVWLSHLLVYIYIFFIIIFVLWLNSISVLTDASMYSKPYKHARIDDTTEHSTHKSKEKEKKNATHTKYANKIQNPNTIVRTGKKRKTHKNDTNLHKFHPHECTHFIAKFISLTKNRFCFVCLTCCCFFFCLVLFFVLLIATSPVNLLLFRTFILYT